MIENAAQFAQWFDAPASEERWKALRTESADADTWTAIIDEFPRCRAAVAENSTVPLEILEKLRREPDFSVQWAVRTAGRWQDAHPEDSEAFHFNPQELAHYDLMSIERDVLRCGLIYWGGPGRFTEQLAVAVGFSSIDNLSAESDRILEAISRSQPLTHIDWFRALLTTEIVFMSDTLGAGEEWGLVTGIPDQVAFDTLRRLQSRLVVRPLRWIVDSPFARSDDVL